MSGANTKTPDPIPLTTIPDAKPFLKIYISFKQSIVWVRWSIIRWGMFIGIIRHDKNIMMI